MTAQHSAASLSLDHAAYFLEEATRLVTAGAPADCPEVARWLDFAKRKMWQGERELAGQKFKFRL